MTGRSTDRGRFRVASAAADEALEERALLQSILQHIRARVQLSRDLAYEMERRRPVRADRRGTTPVSRASRS